MQDRSNELGSKLALFAAVAMIVGLAGVVMSVPGMLDGEWTSFCGLVVGVLGIASGAMIWTGTNAGSALDGMNLGVLWALAHVPYLEIFDRDAGTDLLYPIPSIGAIFTMGSSTSTNGRVASEDVWGIGLLGVILLVSAVAVRKDWIRRIPVPSLHGSST